MRSSNEQYFLITTMDGVPHLSNNGEIKTFHSTQSMRQTAKHLTFTTRQRHHTWGVKKDTRFKAKKHYNEHGYIPLGLLS